MIPSALGLVLTLAVAVGRAAAPAAGAAPADAAAPANAGAPTAAKDPAAAPAPAPATAPSSTAAPPPAASQPSPPRGARKPDQSLENHRRGVSDLVDGTIGSASRPLRFDWRKASYGLSIMASNLAELNEFTSWRLGGQTRFISDGFWVDLGLSWVFTRSTESSGQLARTPYRQWGRPSRVELDVDVALPLAEGIVTAWPSIFPAAELVLSANVGVRYLYYPGALSGAGFLGTLGGLLSAQLTSRELAHLDGHRAPGMAVDPARFGVLVGLNTDVYFGNGVFFYPRVLAAVPLNSVTHLKLWWELTLGFGYAL